MSEIVFKRSMNIGTISAESDKEFLEQCFIETPEFDELCDFNSKKMIILGRTGSGKTALLNKMKDNVDCYIEVKPDTFALQYITNVPFVKKMEQENVNLDIFYKFLWLHELISQIVKNYFAYNKRKLIDELSEKVSDFGRINQLKKYLNEYDGIFFDEGTTEKITKEIEKQVAAFIGNDITKINGKLSDIQKSEIETKASQYINKKQISQLKNIITLFKEYFGHNRQKKIVVVIDNLDENWIDISSKYRLIDALLNAIRLFVDVPNMKILLAMRADLLAKTCEITHRQNEKDESFTLRLNWTSKMLKSLLDKRIEYLFNYKYKKNTKISFSDMFNFYINNESASDYIISRTMMRPRDVISFVNHCISQADNESIINELDVLEAEKVFKQERYQALEHEWINIYGHIDTYFKIMYKFGNEFSFNEIINNGKFSEIEPIAYQNDTLAERIYSRTVDDESFKEDFIKDIINILFTMGIIGIKDNKTQMINYATPYRASLTELDFANDLLLEIHPLFRK